MQTKKIISAGLLILIIVINLGFSMIFIPSSKEGLAVIQNPSDSDLQKMTEILNNSNIDIFMKTQKIYDIATKYAVLTSIYNNIANNCLDTITEYITIAPIKNRDGVNIDENAVSKERIEIIKGILMSKMKSTDKIFAIYPYICNKKLKCDVELSRIYVHYTLIWLDMLNGYVAQLNSEASKQNKITASIFGNIFIDEITPNLFGNIWINK